MFLGASSFNLGFVTAWLLDFFRFFILFVVENRLEFTRHRALPPFRFVFKF